MKSHRTDEQCSTSDWRQKKDSQKLIADCFASQKKEN